MPKRLDLTGQQFADLTALRLFGRQGRYVVWSRRCVCGRVVTARVEALRSGNKKSCGCRQKRAVRAFNAGKAKYHELLGEQLTANQIAILANVPIQAVYYRLAHEFPIADLFSSSGATFSSAAKARWERRRESVTRGEP